LGVGEPLAEVLVAERAPATRLVELVERAGRQPEGLAASPEAGLDLLVELEAGGGPLLGFLGGQFAGLRPTDGEASHQNGMSSLTADCGAWPPTPENEKPPCCGSCAVGGGTSLGAISAAGT